MQQSYRPSQLILMGAGFFAVIWVVVASITSTSQAAPATTTTEVRTEVSSKVEYVPPTIREKSVAEKYDIWLEDGGEDLLGILMESTVATLDASTHPQLIRQCNDLAEAARAMGSYQPLPVPEADVHFKASMDYMMQAGQACASAPTFSVSKIAMEPWATKSDSELGKAQALLRAEGLNV